MGNKLFILFLLLMIAAAPALAQTPTPTPCNPGVDIGHLNFGGNCQSNTIDADTKSDLYRSMATAAYETNRLPEQIQASGTNGQNVVPSTAGAVQIFGYIKWLFSANSAREVLGPTLAPFGINVFIIFLIVVSMTAIYFLINFIVFTMRVVLWFYGWIIKLVELIPFFE